MNNEERRAALDEVYSEICRSIELRVGSFRETDASGNIVKNYEGTVSWPAWRDVELVIDAHYTTFFDGITDLTKQIKEIPMSYSTEVQDNNPKIIKLKALLPKFEINEKEKYLLKSETLFLLIISL